MPNRETSPPFSRHNHHPVLASAVETTRQLIISWRAGGRYRVGILGSTNCEASMRFKKKKGCPQLKPLSVDLFLGSPARMEEEGGRGVGKLERKLGAVCRQVSCHQASYHQWSSKSCFCPAHCLGLVALLIPDSGLDETRLAVASPRLTRLVLNTGEPLPQSGSECMHFFFFFFSLLFQFIFF